MTLQEFEEFVRRNAVWFRGPQPESAESIADAARQLGVEFPATLQWLLLNYGYWRATGVASLPVVIGKTHAFRPAFPESWVVLSMGRNDLSEEVDVANWEPVLTILQTSPSQLIDGAGVFTCRPDGTVLRRYSSFSAYIVSRQQALVAKTRREYLQCPEQRRSAEEPLRTDGRGFDLQEFCQRLWETMLLNEAGVQRTPRREMTERQKLSATMVPRRTEEAETQRSEEQVVEQLHEALPERIDEAEWSAVGTTDESIAVTIPLADVERDQIAEEPVSPAEAEIIREAAVPVRAVGKMVVERRKFLKDQHVDIAAMFEHRSSSPRQGVIFPDRLPSGKLVLYPIDGEWDAASGRPEWTSGVVDSGRAISAIEVELRGTRRRWLATWWSHQEVPPEGAEVLRLEAGASLSVIPGLLCSHHQEISRSASL